MASQYVKLPLTGGGPAAGVASFEGRVGIVTTQSGDYAASEIVSTPVGGVSATDVQAAIAELDSEKQNTITGGASSIVTANLTIDRALISDGAGKVAVSPTSALELSYVDGVTSALQPQIDGKEPSFSVLPISKGGTNSGAALANGRAIVSSAGAIVESAVTSTELGYLSGVTSALQTQLGAKQPLDSTLTALAAYNTNGLITQTAADTFTGRTILGTAGNIAVTNGDGVAGNPTIDLVSSGVAAGTYLSANVTIDAFGRITSAAQGSPSEQYITIGNEFTDLDYTSLTSLARVVAGTGTGTITTSIGVNSTDRAIGVFALDTGTTTTGSASLVSSLLAACATGYATFDYYLRVMVPSLGTAGEAAGISFGFIDDTTATQFHIDGAYFLFFGNGVNTNWQTITTQGSTRTTTTTSVPVVINNFSIFRVQINEAATSVVFSIDGTVVATHTTNIPTGTQRFGRGITIKKNIGTTAASVYIDYERLSVEWSAPR